MAEADRSRRSAPEAPLAPGGTPAEHDHGPVPSYEWILDGESRIVLPHLKTIAPTLTWNGEHFHVNGIEAADADLPERFQIELGEEPVGAVDFLPLPGKRTLMRLYLCSDLGTSCRLERGNDMIQGFANAWLARLTTLGFISARVAQQNTPTRTLGFPLPSDPAEQTAPVRPAARRDA